MRHSLLFLGAFLLASSGALTAQQSDTQEKPKDSQSATSDSKIPPEEAARKNPVPSTPEGLAEARHFYKYQCAMCHGENGDGKGDLVETMKLKMNDWRDASSMEGRSDGQLFYILTNGRGAMVGQGDRTKENMRWNLINLVRSFSKKDSKEKAPETPKQ
ncbi:MAG: c-type cytochrome [Candidatus Acidiferrales bacterium]